MLCTWIRFCMSLGWFGWNIPFTFFMFWLLMTWVAGDYCSIWNFMLLKTPSKLTGCNLTGTFTVGYC